MQQHPPGSGLPGHTSPVAKIGACEIGKVGKDQSCQRMNFPALAGMQTRLSQAGFCFMGSGL